MTDLSSISSSTSDLIDSVISIRPGSEWSINGTVLNWLDQIQSEPTLGEVQTAVSNLPTSRLVKLRINAALLQDDPSPSSKFVKAVLLTAIDEINLLREWITNFEAATAAATSLTDFKTRVAALPAMPDRTVQQAKTAIVNKINSGVSD